jgi:hypothetical protein
MAVLPKRMQAYDLVRRRGGRPTSSLMVGAARTLFSATCLIGVLAPVLAAQDPAVVWRVPDTVGSDDRDAILAIARAVGIREPGAVSVPVRSICLLVQVESQPVLIGNRVLSETLGIRQRSGPDCSPVRPDSRVEQRGNWIALLFESNPLRLERWRIRDGDWHVDLGLGGDVPYGDAVAIVDAIRRRQLIDRRPSSQSSSPIQYFDASRIRSIESRDSTPRTPGVYEITEGEGAGLGGGGRWLIVRIYEGRVELTFDGHWTA